MSSLFQNFLMRGIRAGHLEQLFTNLKPVEGLLVSATPIHPTFLRSFAETVISADPSNFAIMRSTALLVFGKYDLDRYLDNYPSTDGFPPDPEPDPAKRGRS